MRTGVRFVTTELDSKFCYLRFVKRMSGEVL